MVKSLDLMTIVQDREMQCPENAVHVEYAEFYDGAGELVAKFSGSGWIRMNTSEAPSENLKDYTVYKKLWQALALASIRQMEASAAGRTEEIFFPKAEREKDGSALTVREKDYYDLYEEECYIPADFRTAEEGESAAEDKNFDQKA